MLINRNAQNGSVMDADDRFQIFVYRFVSLFFRKAIIVIIVFREFDDMSLLVFIDESKAGIIDRELVAF